VTAPGPDPFGIRRGVLQLHRPPRSGARIFLCWPVLAYRVTAPLLRVRHLNIIEKVVLGLCQGGIREPADIAARIHQNTELCEHVLRQLHGAGQLDQAGTPTEKGRQTLLTSCVGQEPELIVTHVFQDPATRELWPRAAAELRFLPVRRVREHLAQLRLETAGEAQPVDAYIMPAAPRAAPSQPPAAQEIVAAVAAQRQAEIAGRAEAFTAEKGGRNAAAHTAEQDLQALSSELRLPHEAAVHRVLDVGPPAPEYVLVWLRAGDRHNGHGTGLRACDPFGLDPNPVLQKLLTERIRDDPALATLVTGATEELLSQSRQAYQSGDRAVGREAEISLVRLLGSELRRHGEVLDLLVELEKAAARGGAAGMESVAREAYRIYEYMFRRLAADYPAPARPSWDVGRTEIPPEVVSSALESAAQAIGLAGLPGTYRKEQVVRQFSQYPRLIRKGREPVNLETGFVSQLLLYVLVAAADPLSPHRSRHPLRDLARRRPKLLAELWEMGVLRNRGSHAIRDATVEDDIEWCRQLALDAARLIISMPPPIPERT
jgi:hypothetical protein